MSTEETELRFIRCPSCRSLVPAVAVRCRMCGHYFEDDGSEAALDTVEQEKKKSRVRQRTLSVSKDLIEEPKAAEEIAPVLPHEEEPTEASSRSEVLWTEAPVETEIKAEEPQWEETAVAAPAAGSAEPLRLRENLWQHITPISAPDNAVEEEEPSEPALTEQEAFEQKLFPEEPIQQEAQEAREENNIQGEDEQEAILRTETVFQGMKETSLLAEQYSTNEEQEEQPISAAAELEPVVEPLSEEEELPQINRALAEEISVPLSAPLTALVSESLKTSTALPPQQEEIMAFIKDPQEEVASSERYIPAASEKSLSEVPLPLEEEGSLLGWLVSFQQDAKGNSNEIRSGRFFIGKERLRKSDTLIPDGGVSTPHCLVAASRHGGVKIQDLMSEQGTFIKRAGKEFFDRVNDIVVVAHGDCLKFGNYEVLVCLLPGTCQK